MIRLKKFGSLFSGGGGVDVGAKAAGYDLVWGVELRPEIAEVANANLGQHVIAANILELDPADFEAVDLLHASPPCPSFSTAKAGGEETALDIALAQKTADFVAVLLPQVFTLENVYAYRNSKSWAIIAETLTRHGYQFNYWHVNSADYGVPQTRKRMIVVARRDGRTPSLPPATHAENPVPGLFGTLEKWVGWYAAIEDLIPGLPDSEFAPWQLARLPEELTTQLFNGMDMKSTVRAMGGRSKFEPSATVVADDYRRPSTIPSALLVEASNAGGGSDRVDDEPAQTVTTPSGGRVHRAFIVNNNANDTSGASIVADADKPAGTVRTPGGGRDVRGYVGGRVVKMTPRALARFQGFPDGYSLPAHKTLRALTGDPLVPFADETEKNVNGRLAATIIGNAVPPLLYQKLAEYIAQTVL
jgi:DNA (cytosine-5)-methyltransferase 1